MSRGVNIPITVTGGAAAKAEVEAVGQTLRKTANEARAAGQAVQQAASAYKPIGGSSGSAGVDLMRALGAPKELYAPMAAQASDASANALAKEAQGIAGVTVAAAKASTITETLVKNKEKLAAAVTLAGGAFGSATSQVTGLIGMMISAGPVLLGVTAALAALSVGITIFDRIKASAERAEAAIRKLNDARVRAGAAERPASEQIQEDLAKAEPYTRERFKEAFKYYGKVLEQGTPMEAAQKAATAGFRAGVSPEELAMILASGAEPETADEARVGWRAIERDPKMEAELRERVRRQWLTAEGRKSITRGVEIRNEIDRPGSRYFEAAEGVSQDVLLLEEAKRLGLAKEGASLDKLDEMRKEARALETMSDDLDRAGWTADEALRAKKLRQLMEYSALLDKQGVRDEGGTSRSGTYPSERDPGAPTTGPYESQRRQESVQQAVTHVHNNTVNINTAQFPAAPAGIMTGVYEREGGIEN